MSYSIDEGIDDTKKELVSMGKVRERYPTSTMTDGRWFAEGARNDATLVTVKHGEKEDLLYAAAEVGGMYVHDHWGCMSASQMLYTLRREHPEAYAKVVDVVANRKRASPDGSAER
jgi:hypothetical protein